MNKDSSDGCYTRTETEAIEHLLIRKFKLLLQCSAMMVEIARLRERILVADDDDFALTQIRIEATFSCRRFLI